MARPYGTWSDSQIQAEMETRQRQIDENMERQSAHEHKPHAQVDLAHSHMELMLAREGAALSRDMTALYFELELRKQGVVQRLD